MRVYKTIRGLFVLCVFLIIWEITSKFTLPLFVPSPISVFDAIIGLYRTGQLWWGLVYSFRRITIATFLSIGIAIPLALIIYGIPLLKETLVPVVSFLRYVPVTALSPLLVWWFGIGEEAKISFLFIATFVYFLPSVLLAFNDVPQDLMDTGRTIGMKRWETIFEILLPASLPSICSTFLMMYGIGWTYCAVVEASNAVYGLGFIINVSAARGHTNIVFGVIIVIMIFSYIFDKIGNKIIQKIFKWRFVNDHFE